MNILNISLYSIAIESSFICTSHCNCIKLNKSDLIVFGETWLSGYPAWLDYCPEIALWYNEATKDAFMQMHKNSAAVDGEEIAPNKIGLMIMPLLAFSEDGFRVGYGKGFYDKFISGCSSNLLKIGFSYFDATVIDETNKLDKKMDFCITPERIFEF